jgi:hypothetical protein
VKKSVLTLCMVVVAVYAQAQWKPAGDHLKTSWADQLRPANV